MTILLVTITILIFAPIDESTEWLAWCCLACSAMYTIMAA